MALFRTKLRTSVAALLLTTIASAAQQQQQAVRKQQSSNSSSSNNGGNVYTFVDNMPSSSSSSSSTSNSFSGYGTTTYTSSSTSSTQSPFAACTLDCPAYAPCKFGNGNSQSSSTGSPFMDKSMYCDCPQGYMGVQCETSYVPCGDFTCFNGGTCLARVVNDQTVHHCDCTTSYTSDASYAGKYCEYQATSYCTKQSSTTSSTSSSNSHLFCVNGGTCKSDPYQGCDCPSEYTGFSCEYLAADFGSNASSSTSGSGSGSSSSTTTSTLHPVYTPFDNAYPNPGFSSNTKTNTTTSCDLVCQNNGTCAFGAKDLGVINNFIESAPHLNQTQTSTNQHCICPKGFYGLYCEEQLNHCETGNVVCLHGANCEFDEVGEELFWSCDCSTANSSKAANFAGNACEHPINDICSIDTTSLDATPMSFCVNGGQCKKSVTAQEDHPGCNCPQGFSGPHCEIRQGSQQQQTHGTTAPTQSVHIETGSATAPATSSTTASASRPSSTRTGFEILVLVISLIAIALVTIFSVSMYVRNRKRKEKRLTNMLRWSSEYRDQPDDTDRDRINLAPRRQSSLEHDFVTAMTPSFLGAESSSDDHLATYRTAVAHAHHGKIASATSDGIKDSSSSDHDPDEPETAPQVYIGPPRDEDGHELHNVEIL